MCIRDRESGGRRILVCHGHAFDQFIDNYPVLTVLADWGYFCLLYTSDAADERSSVDLGGRRIINKQKKYA